MSEVVTEGAGPHSSCSPQAQQQPSTWSLPRSTLFAIPPPLQSSAQGFRECPSLYGCSVGQDACNTRLRAVRGTPWRDTENNYTNHDF